MNSLLKSAVAVLLGLLALPAFADVELTITQGTITTQPIAVVPFANSSGLPTDVAQVIENDLVNSGVFRTISRNLMLEKPTDPTQIDFRNWRTVGMDDIVIGQMHPEGDGYGVSFYVYDVYRAEQVMAMHVPAVPATIESLRHLSHRIADLIFEKLTHQPGYFSTSLAYVSQTGPLTDRRWSLIRSDYDGENTFTIVPPRADPIMSPVWSPDGRQIAFKLFYPRGESAILTENLATGEHPTLVAEKGLNDAPAWSPDGKSMAVTLSFGFNPDIYVIDLASKQRHRLTTDPAIDTEPTWSPDGQSIAFTSDRGGSPQVYRMNATGGDAQRLTFQGKWSARPVYSPDGKKLAVVTSDGSALRIGLFDLQTSQMKILTDGPIDESPSFSPGGNVIMYTRIGADGGTKLATVTTDGLIKRDVPIVGSEVREPAWSPYIQ